ncbi:large conductance mechanosensitive channel protein MscL [Bifidobacterium simiarum]|uniref:large conductance mechanosensitive channel protein MscL n=1 Tax=Bifidobacterium simiarum TaxID=2045441 RepID=UPI001BDCE457|nr:large conductance mechanosensitive channel protein MscL [Bifidobacterium simiarum]
MRQATQSTAALAKGALNVTEDTARRIVSLTDRGPFGGFKKFISRGSMIDMAVGVVMGSAVTGVVNAIVKYFINPLIAMIGGKPDMSAMLSITFNGATISFGAILNEVINFLLVGVAVYFCVILPINKLRDVTAAALAREQEDADEQAGPSVEERTLAVLEEIRDELRRSDRGPDRSPEHS